MLMELQLPSFSFIFSIIVFLFIAVKMIGGTNGKKSKPKLPPGPWRLPLIGNMHNMVGSGLPQQILADLAKTYGPLMYLELGEVPTIVVSSPEMAQEILKTKDPIFADRHPSLMIKAISYGRKDIAFAPYDNYWRQVRKICTIELLSAKRVQSFQPMREEEASNLIKTIALESKGGTSPVNLSQKIFDLTYGLTAKTAFGNKCKDIKAFMSAVMGFTKLASGFNIADFYPSIGVLYVISGMKSKIQKVHDLSDRILENILKEHREKKHLRSETTTKPEHQEDNIEDFVDVFLELQEKGDMEFSLTDDNIKALIWDAFNGGSETTGAVVEWAMSEMLRNPRVMKKAQSEVRRVLDAKGKVDATKLHELHYLKSVVKETFRLHPPVPITTRASRESCEINGYEIPANTQVMINIWAVGRDPKYWSEAETFYPERFLDSSIDYKGINSEYIPFGAGRRICPGISFSQANFEFSLAQLLYHFDWKLPHGMKPEDLDMSEVNGITVRRKNDLLVVPIPYHAFSNSKEDPIKNL